ncbi:MAG: hypothetical protein WKF47_10410 [Geodermatophilaceae bacterium]
MSEPVDRRRAAGDVDERVVDEHLSDLHRVRSGVADGQLDHLRAQDGALHRQLLDRRPVPFGQRLAAEQSQPEQGRGATTTAASASAHRVTADVSWVTDAVGDRRRPARVGGHPSAPRRKCVGAHQSVTSKKPIQPRSANSVLCAWNMYLPG